MQPWHKLRVRGHGAGLVASLVVVCMLAVSCGYEKTRVLNVPAGSASQTLKEFAKQAQVQIVFDVRSVEGVITNPVEGRLAPEEALDRMVRGTPLYVEHDTGTGAFAIVRRHPARSSAGRSSMPHVAVKHPPAGLFMDIGSKNFKKIF